MHRGLKPALWMAGALMLIAPAGAQAASVTPSSLDFGAVKAGSAGPAQSVIYSVEPADDRQFFATIVDPFGLPTPHYSHTTTCPSAFPAGSHSCAVTVTFKPRSTGSIPGELVVGPMGTFQSVPLTGKGLAATKCKKKGKQRAAVAKKKKGCGKKKK
jgi:hypothetical protein